MEIEDYPSGRLSTKVRSILSLEPPSEAKPACISTAMASTTCFSLPTEVSQSSSSSFKTLTTLLHFPLFCTLRPTTPAATIHATTATLTATPTTTLPMSLHDHSLRPKTPPQSPLLQLIPTKQHRRNMHSAFDSLPLP